MRCKEFFAVLLIIIISLQARTQPTAIIFGKVTDQDKKPMELVTISMMGQTQQTVSDKQGNYQITVPASLSSQIFFSYIGYNTDTLEIFLKAGEKKEYNPVLTLTIKIFPPVDVSADKSITNNFVKINPRIANKIPSPNEGIESLLKTLPGVSSNNEMSSQYSVRGGSYDENLVYVNDIEVYRPFLVRAGQQEGLSFVNTDLVSDVEFSAGGFDAQYGDKMSSVLDIKYKKPTAFAGAVSGSLLGYSGYVEGLTPNARFSYLAGIRQKSNQYLLNSLDTKGDYKPSFTDFQALMNYVVNEKFNIDFLGNYARNVYKVIPQTRQTDFGTLDNPIRLTIYFDGQEVDRFDTYFGAFSGNYNPQKNLHLKFIASAFQTSESETYDVQGQYWLDQLESNLGSPTFGSVAYNMGVGTFLNHARDYLNATVANIEHKGTYISKNHVKYWGLRYQREIIDDKLSEWQMSDSAGYTQPYATDSIGYTNPLVQPKNPLNMQNVLNVEHSLSSNRYSGYYEQKWIIDHDSTVFSISAGVRSQYWGVNKQLLVSPRGTVSFKPNWEKKYVYRFSTGYYSQPPFFQEMIDFSGNMNTHLKAQTSIHFVLAQQHDFMAWGRPFRYNTELYYKILKDLVPYEVNDVRIQYYAKNDAHGYAAGIDMKVNGEFVKGIESWASLSIMNTRENLDDDFYYTYYNKEGQVIIPNYTADEMKADSVRHNPGYIPRPTDQLVNFALFFQDFLPSNPTFKMHLTLTFGSGLPFGPLGHNRYKDTLRMLPYRRVDIGFSKQIIGEGVKNKPRNIFRNFKSVWLSLEVFNLLQVNNTISYIWITDVNNNQYAVPNYLTPRQLNLKLIAEF